MVRRASVIDFSYCRFCSYPLHTYDGFDISVSTPVSVGLRIQLVERLLSTLYSHAQPCLGLPAVVLSYICASAAAVIEGFDEQTVTEALNSLYRPSVCRFVKQNTTVWLSVQTFMYSMWRLVDNLFSSPVQKKATHLHNCWKGRVISSRKNRCYR